MTFQSLRQYLKGQTVYLFHFHTFLSSFLLPIFHVTCTVLWVQATETAPVIWGIFIAWAWVLTKPLERVEEIGLWVLLTKLLGSRWCGIAAAIHVWKLLLSSLPPLTPWVLLVSPALPALISARATVSSQGPRGAGAHFSSTSQSHRNLSHG